METLIAYPMYLFWHDQVWRHRLRHMGQKMTSLNIFLKFVSCTVIWYKYSISNVDGKF